MWAIYFLPTPKVNVLKVKAQAVACARVRVVVLLRVSETLPVCARLRCAVRGAVARATRDHAAAHAANQERDQ